jgi:hypothetical protein
MRVMFAALLLCCLLIGGCGQRPMLFKTVAGSVSSEPGKASPPPVSPEKPPPDKAKSDPAPPP